MAAVLVGQFHARDAEGRIYSVHEFQESVVDGTDSTESTLKVTYKLAIGDRVRYLGDDRFELVHSGTEITRVPEYVPPAV